ncbi:MAG: hypothetical protein ACI304_05870 [Lepagella sp.]
MRSKDESSLRIVDLWTFKSTKSNKRYIVEVEGFENDFYGLKFYWKGVEKSKDRYSLLTHDYEPRVIIATCIEIMMSYYRKNPNVSFGFIAAPDLKDDIRNKGLNEGEGSRRFRFYQKVMINLFGPQTFYQVADVSKTFYLMINNNQLSRGIITVKDIETKINQIYLGNFVIDE